MIDRPKAGQLVLALIREPGTGSGVAALETVVLNAGLYESDLILIPSEENLATAAEVLADIDVPLESLVEGPVYVLRNMQNTDLDDAFRIIRS